MPTSPRTLARIAGSLYLVVVVGGIFAVLYVRAGIVKPGDATATADHIRESATLFRVGFVSNLVASTCFLLTAMALYLLLRHVQPHIAAAMVTFVAVSVAIGCLNLLNQYTALTIATGDDYRRALGEPASDALTMLFVTMSSNGSFIAAMFFGLWLLPLGYLVLRSGLFPKALGILLVVGGAAWLVDLFTHFLAPGLDTSVGRFCTAVAGIAELSFVAWLLVVAVRVPDARVPAVAR